MNNKKLNFNVLNELNELNERRCAIVEEQEVGNVSAQALTAATFIFECRYPAPHPCFPVGFLSIAWNKVLEEKIMENVSLLQKCKYYTRI